MEIMNLVDIDENYQKKLTEKFIEDFNNDKEH